MKHEETENLEEKNTRNRKKLDDTESARIQVLLAMARNLSIGTRCKKDSEGKKVPKRAKNG